MSTALILRREAPQTLTREAANLWLIYLREPSGNEVMLHISKTTHLETCETVIESFRGHGDVYAVPG